MNKKLLLSFAVFATALSVNAQKPLYKGIAKKSMSVEFQTNAVVESKTEINPIVMSNSSSKKRLVTKTIKDTLSIAGNKKTYGHPHHAFSTNRTMKLKLYKTGNDTEFLSAHQRYDNTQPLKLNGFGVSMTAYHDNTPVVALVFLRSKKTKELDSIIPVELSINVVKSSTGSITSSTRWFKPTTPISISDTFMIEVLPKAQTDSVGVTATGAYYGSTRAVAKIDGTTLTVNDKSPANDTTYSGWATDLNGYFKGGFVVWNSTLNDFFITGKNVLPGTYITGQTGAFTYTVNKTQTVAETDINQNLKVYKTFNGLLGVNQVKAGIKSFDYYFAYDDGKGKSVESDWLMYPDVEYTVNSDPKANDVCKGTDGTVSVTFDAKNRNVLENPTFNKLAFFQKYLGLDKSKNYFYSTVQNGKGSTKFVGMIDFKSTSLTVDTKLDSLDKLDTLYMVDYILPYGFSKTAAAVTFGHALPISNTLAKLTTITPLTPKCYYDKANDALSLKGYAPYTGLPKVGDAAGTFKVTDANGCSVDITTTAPIAAVPAKFTWTSAAKVDAAKCFGDKAKVTVTITGGTGTYTGLTQEFATTAAVQTKNIIVADANGCRDTVKNVSIPVGPTRVVATATVVDAKCFGDSAKVTIAATGGTGNSFTGTGVKLIANPKVSTVKYAVIDANLCKSDSVSASIKAAPAKIAWTSAAKVDNAKCFGEKAKVTVTITGAITGTYTGLTQEFATTASNQTKNIVVADPNGCRDTVKNVLITAAPSKLEATTSSIAAHGSAKDGSASVVVTGGTSPYKYSWLNSTETTATITVGNGTYTPTVTDANNCTLTAAAITVAVSSVESLSISGLSIYPNPVANELNVKFNANSAATIELVNVAGQVIVSKDASEFANVTFDTATLNAGVYFVNIKVAEGVFTQKIIKE